MTRSWDSEKVMLLTCFLFGFITGFRHGGGIILGLLGGIAILPLALFATELPSTASLKKRVALVITALAIFGSYKSATGPIRRGGGDLCVDVGRWGQEKCE